MDVLQVGVKFPEPIGCVEDFLSRIDPADVSICGVRFSDILDPNLEDSSRVSERPCKRAAFFLVQESGLLDHAFGALNNL
jgi:hypothetical protein